MPNFLQVGQRVNVNSDYQGRFIGTVLDVFMGAFDGGNTSQPYPQVRVRNENGNAKAILMNATDLAQGKVTPYDQPLPPVQTPVSQQTPAAVPQRDQVDDQIVGAVRQAIRIGREQHATAQDARRARNLTRLLADNGIHV